MEVTLRLLCEVVGSVVTRLHMAVTFFPCIMPSCHDDHSDNDFKLDYQAARLCNMQL